MSGKAFGLTLAGLLACLGARWSIADEGHVHKEHAHEVHQHEEGGHPVSPAGMPGKAKDVSRVIHVRMLDSMRFEPAAFQVKSGETIRFVVRNAGRMRHEFGLGTAEEQSAHAEMMLADPQMQHDDGNVVSVAPGEAATLIWRFGQPGEYQAGCQVPGHYASGMKAAIAVTAR